MTFRTIQEIIVFLPLQKEKKSDSGCNPLTRYWSRDTWPHGDWGGVFTWKQKIETNRLSASSTVAPAYGELFLSQFLWINPPMCRKSQLTGTKQPLDFDSLRNRVMLHLCLLGAFSHIFLPLEEPTCEWQESFDSDGDRTCSYLL